MEATAALGLAGNVVQFVDFGRQLCQMFLEIWSTSRGLTNSNADAQKRIEIFLASLEKIKADLGTYSRILSGVDGDNQLKAITERCNHIARDLLRRLDGLGVKGEMRKWKAAVATVRSMWKEDELIKLQEQLRRYREELMWIIILSVRADLSLLESWQKDQFSELQSAVIAKLTQIIQSQLSTLPILRIPEIKAPPSPVTTQASQPSALSHVVQSTPINESILLPSIMASQSSSHDEKAAVDSSLAMAETIASKLAENDRQILETLNFLVMQDREDAISEAEAATLDWVFEDHAKPHMQWSNFSKWLAEDNSAGIYWVNGKAGSGKSTLMKHLFRHHKTRSALARWANGSKMLLAGFFFSYNGEDLQKSQTGLMRALLYACLKDHRELIPLVVPDRIDFIHAETRNYWSLNRLETAFRRLVSQKVVPIKFCFLIDGLDEYAGRHADVANILVDAARHSHVKVCTSSRPLLVFEKAFLGFPGLVLQNLTFPDIERFVKRKLVGHDEMRALEKKEPGLTESLTSYITSKASGVFLWVTLVVGSLLEGSENFDEACDLKRRLEELPQDLEELYQHMIERVKPSFYLEEGFRLLLLTKAAGGSIDVLTLAFGGTNTGPINTGKMFPMVPTRSDQEDMCTRLIGRMKSRCLGLLEASDSTEEIVTTRVTFLHKSVSDFLETDNAKRAIEVYLGPNLSTPEINLLRGALWMLKTYPARRDLSLILKRRDFFDHIRPVVVELKKMARKTSRLEQATRPELEELHRVANALWNMVAFKSHEEKIGRIDWQDAPRDAGAFEQTPRKVRKMDPWERELQAFIKISEKQIRYQVVVWMVLLIILYYLIS